MRENHLSRSLPDSLGATVSANKRIILILTIVIAAITGLAIGFEKSAISAALGNSQYGANKIDSSTELTRNTASPADYQSAWIENPVNFEGDAPLFAWGKNPEVRSKLINARMRIDRFGWLTAQRLRMLVTKSQWVPSPQKNFYWKSRRGVKDFRPIWNTRS